MMIYRVFTSCKEKNAVIQYYNQISILFAYYYYTAQEIT